MSDEFLTIKDFIKGDNKNFLSIGGGVGGLEAVVNSNFNDINFYFIERNFVSNKIKYDNGTIWKCLRFIRLSYSSVSKTNRSIGKHIELKTDSLQRRQPVLNVPDTCPETKTSESCVISKDSCTSKSPTSWQSGDNLVNLLPARFLEIVASDFANWL